MEKSQPDVHAILERIDDLFEWRRSTDGRLSLIERTCVELRVGQSEVNESLKKNNDMTAAILDVVTAVSIGKKVLIWLAVTLGAIAGIWASVTSLAGPHTPH